MTIWTNKTLSDALKISVPNAFKEGEMVQFNSQDVNKGDIFIALKITGDGHDYASDALANGASLVIGERELDTVPKDKMLVVPSTFAALKSMAEYKRKNSNATFVAVTGSAGKTSTKEALGFMLSKFANTFASRGSFNNQLGVELNLASIADDTKYAVLEVGMNNTGEIRAIIHFIKPDIVLINNILPAHLGNFSSIKAIADAKLEILEGLKPYGTAIFNADNEFYEYCCDKAKKLGIKNILSFGTGESADSRLIFYNFEGTLASATVSLGGAEYSFKTSIGGHHRILNLAAALLIGSVLKIDILTACRNFADLTEPKGRGKVSNIVYNGKKCIIIDDSYNASPIALQHSLKHLADLKHNHKVAILGDMREMGVNEIDFHTGLLPHVIKSGVKKLHTVGVLMSELHKILPEDIKGNHYPDYKALQADLENVIDQEMMLLLKASKGVKLWSVVELLVGQ